MTTHTATLTRQIQRQSEKVSGLLGVLETHNHYLTSARAKIERLEWSVEAATEELEDARRELADLNQRLADALLFSEPADLRSVGAL